MAAKETLESTVTANMVQAETLSIGYGALGTVNDTALLIASVTVGILWTAVSPTFAFGLAGC